MIDISIVIVSWNSRSYLGGCLSSIKKGVGSIEADVTVVDNGSGDGSAEFVRNHFPEARLVANTGNRGFAAANNQALSISHGRYALLLNPDTKVHPGAIEGVIRFMDEHKEIGACGCRLLNEDGTVQHVARRFPTYGFALETRTILGRLGLFRKSADRVRMRGERFESLMEVDQPSGAALFLRREALDAIGLLDERYFIFFEEVDLCRRIKDAGYRIYIYPGASIIHYGGRSRRQNRAGVILPGVESLLCYFRKHEGGIKNSLFELLFRPLFAISICIESLCAGCEVLWGELASWPVARISRKREISRAYGIFLRRDLIGFLLNVWG